MSFTPFNAPLLSNILGDLETAAFFSVKADLDAMLTFEVALAQVQAESGVIPADAAARIAEVAETFAPDVRALSAAAGRDGLIVPAFVRQLREAVGDVHAEHVHVATTSQDLIDTSLVLRLKQVDAVLLARMDAVLERLNDLAERYGQHQLMAQTRMQPAIPITVADRLALWSEPLRRHRKAHAALAKEIYTLQLGGPVGTLDGLGEKAATVRRALARKLDLVDPERCWHTDRAPLVAYTSWLSQITGTLGKLGQDIALMAQSSRDAIAYTNGGTSSAMPHKNNPVKAESLVTLARFNATLIAGLHQSLVHEQERSGAAWSLEWMLLPQMVVATGAALRNATDVIGSIETIGEKAAQSGT